MRGKLCGPECPIAVGALAVHVLLQALLSVPKYVVAFHVYHICTTTTGSVVSPSHVRIA